jgi:glycosyltransferase involved in cell wall biosynthesis
MSEPLISICIPVYNASSFVGQTIESVLRQSYRKLDILVLDNASTDETPEIIRSFKDDRLRCVRHDTNLGAIANFNAGLALARGDWVKIVCADDTIHDTCIARQWKDVCNAGAEEVVLATCARDIVDEAGRRWLRRGYPSRRRTEPGASAIRRTLRAGTNIFGEPAAILMRRDIALKAGGFNPAFSFCVDVDLWVRILAHGNIVITPDALCTFRVSSKAWSVALARQQAKQYREWMAKGSPATVASITALERTLGGARATLLMWLRLLLYQVVLRR